MEGKKLNIREFAEKFDGKIIINIYNCTINKVMEIAKDLGEPNGEYWLSRKSSGIRFTIDEVEIHTYFPTYFPNEEEKEKV